MPAVSKKQQRFMGMVHAVQEGDIKAPSKAVAETAKSMSKQDAKDFAKTKTKNLPEKKSAALALSAVLCKAAGMEKEAEGEFWNAVKPYLPYMAVGGLGGLMLGSNKSPWWQRLLAGGLLGGLGGYGVNKYLLPWLNQAQEAPAAAPTTGKLMSPGGFARRSLISGAPQHPASPMTPGQFAPPVNSRQLAS